MEKKILNVSGMSCEHCVKAVTRAVGGLNGVTDVSVDLKSGTAAFNYESAVTSLDAIKAAITDAGYEVN